MNLVYTMRCIDERLARVGTESRAADGRRRGAGFIEGSEGEAEGENERADVSEVIEATGHPGRKSHESRASGREQCRAALLVRLLLPSLSRHFSRRSSLLLLFLLFFFPRRTSRLFRRSPTFASAFRTSGRFRRANRHRHCSASPLYLLDLIRAAD